METLLVLLFFPIAWPFVAKRIWHTTINWQEMCLQIAIVAIAVAVIWELGRQGKTHDIEIWNGEILSKDRDHGHYLRPYQCNCRTVTYGSGDNEMTTTECDTCWEDRYTVTWSAKTTVGDITFDHLDSGSRSVYLSPDPSSYERCTHGEPASLEHAYTNYVKAVPESLFHDNSELDVFNNSIPAYPRVKDFYKINRVLEVGMKLPKEAHENLNTRLNEELRKLGRIKQVNIILIITSITDPSYRYAVERAWLGGKKNDVVLFVGVKESRIVWTDVMTWALNTGNELFHVKMRDGLRSLETIDSTTMVPLVVEIVKKHFTRPKMADFEYLKDAVEPPLWALIVAIMFAIGGSIGLTVVFHRTEVDFFHR